MVQTDHHHYYLEHLGIEYWLPRKQIFGQRDLERLSQAVSQCRRCALHETRTKTVFSRGNPQAKLMIVGEAPGYHEDQEGLPFVGKAGHLLDQMVRSIGLSNESIYIANVLKCRPPNNRDPKPEEVHLCRSYLEAQITIIQPQIILTVGRFAAHALLNSTDPLTKLRRQVHDYHGIRVFASYHPAYLLRNPLQKKHAYHDWLAVKQYYEYLSLCDQ